jgi:tetratricopeptide (TPR) repeat protein
MDKVPFLGRRTQLDVIDELIADYGRLDIICITAPGGIGKSRLLQEVYQAHADDDHLKVCDILDFDDRNLQHVRNVATTTAQMFSKTAFEPFYRAHEKWYRMEAGIGVSSDQLEQAELAATRAFIDCFNAVSAQQRVLGFFDTTEAIAGTRVESYIRRMIVELQNCVILWAGRRAGDFGAAIQARDGVSVRVIELEPFLPSESTLYLQHEQRLLNIKVEEELAEKLLLLAAGRPILIDLAAQWRARGISLDWFIKSSIASLRALPPEQLSRCREEFEQQLVQHIIETREPIDWLILALTHVYPLNVTMIASLLSLSADEAASLMEAAQSYVFIKSQAEGSISLQDEMRRMVNEYVWPELDPEIRRSYSSLVVPIFLEQIAVIEQQIKNLRQKETETDSLNAFIAHNALLEQLEVLTTQYIEHALFADISSGFEQFEKTVRQARYSNRYRLAKKLYDVALGFLEGLNSHQRQHLQLVNARNLYDTGNARQAREILRELLDAGPADEELRADIYNALAVCETKIGNINEALRYQTQSLNLLQDLKKDKRVPLSANYLGYIYRLHGNWNKALENYHLALDTAARIENPQPNPIAATMNNMGYVFSLEGKYAQGETLCQSAIDIWKGLQLDKQVSRGEITIAQIWRDQGSYERAISTIEQALRRLELPEDSEMIVRGYFALAWTQWFQGVHRESTDILYMSRDSFEKALEIAEKYYVITEIPGILCQASNVYWLLEEREKARQYLDKAFELSKDLNDIRYAVDSICGMAEFDYEEGKFETIPRYAEMIKKEYEDEGYDFPLFFGRMRCFLANIAFLEYKYDRSLELFAEGIALIYRHGGYEMYSIDHALEDLERKIKALPHDQAHDWISYLNDYWTKQQPAEASSSLITWCQQQLVDIALHLKG